MYSFSQPITKFVTERNAYSVSFLVDGHRMNVGEVCSPDDTFGFPAQFMPNLDSAIAEAARGEVAKLIPTLKF